VGCTVSSGKRGSRPGPPRNRASAIRRCGSRSRRSGRAEAAEKPMHAVANAPGVPTAVGPWGGTETPAALLRAESLDHRPNDRVGRVGGVEKGAIELARHGAVTPVARETASVHASGALTRSESRRVRRRRRRRTARREARHSRSGRCPQPAGAGGAHTLRGRGVPGSSTCTPRRRRDRSNRRRTRTTCRAGSLDGSADRGRLCRVEPRRRNGRVRRLAGSETCVRPSPSWGRTGRAGACRAGGSSR